MAQLSQASSDSEPPVDPPPATNPAKTNSPLQEPDLEATKPPGVDNDKSTEDSNLITWDEPEDPANPKYWSRKDKWVVTVLVSLYTFISPVSSSMVAPALEAVGKDLDMRSDIEVEMALSIFVLGYAVGPLFFGPISEIFGRSRILQLSNMFYLAWNLGCGFAQNRAEFFVFRFLAGVGGSAPLAIGAGVIRYGPSKITW